MSTTVQDSSIPWKIFQSIWMDPWQRKLRQSVQAGDTMQDTSGIIADVIPLDATFPTRKIPNSLCQGTGKMSATRQGLPSRDSLLGSDAGSEGLR